MKQWFIARYATLTAVQYVARTSKKGEAAVIQPPPRVFLDITSFVCDRVTLRRGCSHAELHLRVRVAPSPHLRKVRNKKLHLDTVKICLNTKCNLGWMCYSSICTRGIFWNVFIRRLNPVSSIVNGKSSHGFKKSNFPSTPFKMH